MDPEEIKRNRQDAVAFLMHHKVGIIATCPLDTHQPHASMVHYVADEDFNIYILTLDNSRKAQAIEKNPRVAFTVANPAVPQTLQIEGVAMDISLDEEALEKKEKLFEALNSNPWFYGPLSKLDPADSVVIWIKPQWVRWADYAFAQSGSEHVLREIPLK